MRKKDSQKVPRDYGMIGQTYKVSKQCNLKKENNMQRRIQNSCQTSKMELFAEIVNGIFLKMSQNEEWFQNC